MKSEIASLAVSKLKSMKLEALSKLRGGGRDLRERRMRHQGLRDLAMKCESAECRVPRSEFDECV